MKSLTTPLHPDSELIQILQEDSSTFGDLAFTGLHWRYKDRVYRICLNVTRHVEDAKDASQETFVTVWCKLHSFTGRGTFSSWLSRIALNKSINVRKAAQRWTALVGGELEGDEGVRVGAWCSFNLADCRDFAGTCLEQLPNDDRHILTARFYSGMSYNEISSALELPLGTVKSRLSRALRHARELQSFEACLN